MADDLLHLTDCGLYCPAGNFHIDPWLPVPRAVLTHAHRDHATPGCGHYLVLATGEAVVRTRLGPGADLRPLLDGEERDIGDATVSLHPAGHILGSAQVRIEHQGQVWVVSGDYKLEPDVTCASFEPVRCHVFVTESTFGEPRFVWRPQQEILNDINVWWRGNQEQGKASIVYAYALGKAQRVLAGLDPDIGPIFVHGQIATLNRDYRAGGILLPPYKYVGDAPRGTRWDRAVILAPPSIRHTTWKQRFGPSASALVSGWMHSREENPGDGLDRGFALSDHADWPGLLRAVEATRAQRVLVTHGEVETLVTTLHQCGLDVSGLATPFEGECDSGE